MKGINHLILAAILSFQFLSSCSTLNEIIGSEKLESIKNDLPGIENLIQQFNADGPISTTFQDARYEAVQLADFEPSAADYFPMELQPKAPGGGYALSSGLYTMNAQSFCLRGYTHGPSRGDGHLYAPLEGKKADFVQLILERYGRNAQVSQQNVQSILWAIIAGADMNTLNKKYAQTLQQLFSTTELLEFQGRDWLAGMTDTQIQKYKQQALNKMSPKLQNMLQADASIRNLVQQNSTYQQLEQIAIIAGVAPREDMIREVTKGRWSKHPDGYYVRFFPNGYKQTRVDVYVPFKGDETLSSLTNIYQAAQNGQEQQITFNPAEMVATPANQSSQRIGISETPVPEEENDTYSITFLAYDSFTPIEDNQKNKKLSFPGHIFLAFNKNGKPEAVKGFSPDFEVDENNNEFYLLKFHELSYCIEVDEDTYQKARSIRAYEYFIGTNDCVTYADEVAELIGLNTPHFGDAIVWPITYLEFLKMNNPQSQSSACPSIAKAPYTLWELLWEKFSPLASNQNQSKNLHEAKDNKKIYTDKRKQDDEYHVATNTIEHDNINLIRGKGKEKENDQNEYNPSSVIKNSFKVVHKAPFDAQVFISPPSYAIGKTLTKCVLLDENQEPIKELPDMKIDQLIKLSDPLIEQQEAKYFEFSFGGNTFLKIIN